jgi:hypothetical protein
MPQEGDKPSKKMAALKITIFLQDGTLFPLKPRHVSPPMRYSDLIVSSSDPGVGHVVKMLNYPLEP